MCEQTQAYNTPAERSGDDGGVTGPHAKEVLPKALRLLPGGDLHRLPGAGCPSTRARMLSWPRHLQSANLAAPPLPPSFLIEKEFDVGTDKETAAESG